MPAFLTITHQCGGMTTMGAVINQLPLDLFEGGPLNDQGLDLPAFDERGLLPAIVFSDTEAGKIKRLAPYPTDWQHLVERFGWTDQRKALLGSLAVYRKGLIDSGLHIHFQLLGGSFTEATDTPNDIDCVTFAHLPASASTDAGMEALVKSNPTLFLKTLAKPHYKIDGAFVFTPNHPTRMVSLAYYWFTLFSYVKGSGQHKGTVALI